MSVYTNMIRTLRLMGGQDIKLVKLVSLSTESMEFSDKTVQTIRDALKESFKEFEEPYMELCSRDSYALEDVIYKGLMDKFSDIIGVTGVDIVYCDKTIRIRFIVDGVDTDFENLGKHVRTRSFITYYNSCTVTVREEKYITSKTDESWKYYITI